ncbi:hypothetical protein LSCM1_07641 [Leishmania martiniquensis]|uniref:Uncharacterized protein n=1 Tax=Leishmania martiniquensis TaxID=1580590 RepID=A0A836HQA3_9TRYP|nr:hypothetical protein LSCM1_07641 [Leishmania martiniquensis]
MSSREASGATADAAPASSSAEAQRHPPEAVAVPAPLQCFYTHFITLLTRQARCGPGAAIPASLAPYQHRSTSTTNGQGGIEDEELRRLTCAQEETLGPLLWQWLVLFSLAVELAGDVPEECSPAPSAMAAVPAERSLPVPHILGPYEVERLFHSGFASLPPVAATGGGVGGLSGRRLPTVDPPAPWRNVPLAKRGQSERAFVAALSALSRNGPLFSAWCALCYTCVGASLVTSTSQGCREGGHVAAGPSQTAFFVAEEPSRVALRRLRRAWDSAVELSVASTKGSRESDALAERASVDSCATMRLWAMVYKTCATSTATTAVAPVAQEKGDGADQPPAPPLCLSLWAAQWYRECTRVAAYGADEGFYAEEAGVPVELVTRVMRYLCHRLEAEVAKRAQRHDRSGTTTSLTATVEREEAYTETAVPPSSPLHCDASAPAPLVPALRVGTLAALALQPPKLCVEHCAGRRGRAAKRSGDRKGGAPLRRQRRVWHLDYDEDDSDEDDDDSEEDPDCRSGRERSRRGRTDAQTGVSRLIFGPQEQFEVAIASGVLTTYSMSPADDAAMSPTGWRYMPLLISERYLRNGTVHWWTVRNSQRHRQLIAEARSTSL